MADEKDSKRAAALRRQVSENLRLASSRKLGPPPERLTELVKELAKALAERFPER